MTAGFDLGAAIDAEKLRETPRRAVIDGLFRCYQGLWYTATSRVPVGTNVFERQWDLLVVLDACRVDAIRAVADEYAFIGDVGTVQSVGSHSHEWITQTFSMAFEAEIRETAYLTANGHEELVFTDREFPPTRQPVPFYWTDWDVVEPAAFGRLEMLWKRFHDEDLGVVPPNVVTDAAIETGRSADFDRVIAHYMQPHGPYIAAAIRNGTTPTGIEADAWRSLKQGRVDRETLWELYLDNLRLALDSVETLLENVDAERVVITADHGEAFGELSAHGHPEGFLHPAVRTVPWIETTATDTDTREPDLDRQQATDIDIHDHLADLGYLE